MKRILEITGIITLAVCSAAAQDNSKVVVQKMTAELDGLKTLTIAGEAGVMGQPVLGAPYSATEVNETTQTLADGTRIHNEHESQVYRDGAGRTRRENGDMITIMDPVAKVRYTINTENKTAFSMPLNFMDKVVLNRFEAGGGRGGPITNQFVMVTDGRGDGPVTYSYSTSSRDGDTVITRKMANSQARRGAENAEDLGSQPMEGVVAEGSRTTRTIEAGAIGNDRPIAITSERWYSSQLQTIMMTRQNDPRTGENVFRLTNVKLGEPDPSLFQVPAGYQVTERK